jgi:uncharacterized repeat protein (TIGR01451 family)
VKKAIFVATMFAVALISACNSGSGTTASQIDAAIVKSHSATFTAGSNGTYTIAVTNAGTSATTGVITVTDTLPTGMTFVSAAGTAWSCSAAGQTVTCTNPGPIAAAGAAGSISLVVAVASTVTGSVSNTATVSTPGDTNAANNSSTDTMTVNAAPAPKIAITKSHSGNFAVGANGVFTIAVSNTGNAATTGTITVTDTLPTGLTFISGTGTNWTCASVAPLVTCTNPGPIAAAGAAGNVTLTTAVALSAGASISNTATAATTGSANASSTDVVTILSPDLAIAKSHTGSFTAGSNGVFTIAVNNAGTAPTSGAITVTDTLNSNFTFVSAVGTGWTCVNASQLVTCTNAGPIANGSAAANITLTVFVSASAPVGNLTNTAVVATLGDNNAANNSSTDTVAVNSAPDLAIVKTATSSFTSGSTSTFNLAVNNVGTGPTTGAITVTDVLSSEFVFVSAAGTNWTCSTVGQLGPTVTCTNPGPIASGSAAADITLTVSVRTGVTGNISNTATVQTANDNNASNNSSTVSVPLIASPDLSILKIPVGTFAAGSNGTYRVSLNNVGAISTTGTITVTDTLNSVFTFVSGTGTNWTCTAVLQVVTCTNPGPIASGAAAGDITLTVAINSTASGSIGNSANVSDPGDLDMSDNNSQSFVNIVPSAQSIVVAISNPSNTQLTVGTGAVVNFLATITNGAAGVGVNWTVNGIAGGNSTVGTITPSTSGATQPAIYTAPATLPGTGAVIVATYAGTGGQQSQPVTISLVANQNSVLAARQYVFQTRGFAGGPGVTSGLPIGMVGTFTSDGAGGLSKVLIDTNAVQSGGGSTFTSKVPWNGTYAMDSATHGLIHLTLASNAAIQMNFGFEFNQGQVSGSLVELDAPLGATAFGIFSGAESSAFTTAPGGVNGPWVVRLDGPTAPGNGNTYKGVVGQVLFVQTGSSTTAGTLSGNVTDQGGNSVTVQPASTITMDADGSGHGSIALSVSGGDTPTLSIYVAGTDRIFILESDSNNQVQTGVFEPQTIPVGGFTAANALSSQMLFEAIGVNGTSGHASVIVGSFSPNTSTQQVTGEYDASDGGTVPAGSPVQLTGSYTVDPTIPGKGTLTFMNGSTTVVSFVFYLQNSRQGFILEQASSGVTETRVGIMGAQTEPAGGFVNSTLNGETSDALTETTTPASTNGIAQVQFGTGNATATADFSFLNTGYAIGGTASSMTNFTDPVRGRGTLTTSSGSIFGATTCVFYAVDNSGAMVIISIDPTLLEPQIILLGFGN